MQEILCVPDPSSQNYTFEKQDEVILNPGDLESKLFKNYSIMPYYWLLSFQIPELKFSGVKKVKMSMSKWEK